MAHAEICPVCNGKGTLEDRTLENNTYYPSLETKVCHGCNGKGWIEIQDSYIHVQDSYVSTNSHHPSCTCHLKGKGTVYMPCQIHG